MEDLDNGLLGGNPRYLSPPMDPYGFKKRLFEVVHLARGLFFERKGLFILACSFPSEVAVPGKPYTDWLEPAVVLKLLH